MRRARDRLADTLLSWLHAPQLLTARDFAERLAVAM
jgi:hypothetical protein